MVAGQGAHEETCVLGNTVGTEIFRNTAILSLCLGLLAVLPRGDAVVQAQSAKAAVNPVDTHNRKLAAKARKQGRRPEGVLPLLQLWHSWGGSTPSRTRELLDGLAADRRLPPARRVLAGRLAALAQTRAGDPAGAQRRMDELGYIKHFRVIGPFDNEGKAGLAAETPVEAARMQAPDMQATYPGRERPVAWRTMPDVVRNGYVSLGSILRPFENVCGLAETFVKSERAQALSLWVGSGGASRVYWNGEKVHEDTAYRRPHPDRHAVMVGAHEGWNRLLIKSCVSDGAWGFYVRLGDKRGAPATDLIIKTETTAALDISPGHAKGVRLPRLAATPLAALEAAAAKKNARGIDLSRLARILNVTGADDPAERRAKQLIERAVELDPTVEHLALAVKLSEERGDVMRFAARAARLHPGDARVKMLTASVTMGGAVPEEALPLLLEVPRDSEAYPSAMLARASLLRDMDLPGAARHALLKLRREVGAFPRLLSALAGVEAAAGHGDAAVALRRERLAMRHDDFATRRGLLADALNRGEVAVVQEHIDRMLELRPASLSLHMSVAGYYDALGRDDLRMATLRRAIELVPEAAEPRVAYGRALLRAGDDQGAADAFFEALALRPQDATTRELLEQIKPEAHADEAYAASPKQILERRTRDTAYPTSVLHRLSVTTVYDNGLGSRFHQIANQAHDEEGARQLRTTSIQYDPDTQRVDIRLARVYRADGSVLESMETYEQQLGEPWYRIYYDTRALVVVYPDLEPGDVVELRYRVDDIAHRNLFADYYGDIDLLQGFSPIRHEEIVLITPAARTFYRNDPKLPNLAHTTRVDGKRRIDHWISSDVPALVAEAGMPGITEVSPYLHVSTYKTWEDVGSWYWGLIKDQLYADESLKSTVADITADAKTTRQKVQRIHNWVVGHTRYVGLEFGIHGFLPYRVPLIVQRGFGDCKDKASLMYTMFREAGVDARIVLVRTRRNGRIDDLPASLAIFDHAIAYVPELDLYLDGTAEHSGTTELPTGDQGVTVLLVGPDGAELRRTPSLEADASKRERTLDVALLEDGSAKLDVREKVTGSDAAGYRGYYEAAGTRSERFERALGRTYPGAKLESQRFEGLDDLESPVSYSYRVGVPKLAHWDGDDLRLAPSVLSDLVRGMARTQSRTHLLDLDGASSYREQRTVEVPAGLHLGPLPSGGEAVSPFGRLSLRFDGGAGKVTATTEFSILRDRVPASEYPKFRKWVEEADQLLKQRIDLRRGEP